MYLKHLVTYKEYRFLVFFLILSSFTNTFFGTLGIFYLLICNLQFCFFKSEDFFSPIPELAAYVAAIYPKSKNTVLADGQLTFNNGIRNLQRNPPYWKILDTCVCKKFHISRQTIWEWHEYLQCIYQLVTIHVES